MLSREDFPVVNTSSTNRTLSFLNILKPLLRAKLPFTLPTKIAEVFTKAIEGAKNGCYDSNKALKYCENYYLSENKKHFSQYFDTKYDKFCIKEEFKKHVHFFEHDILYDSLFNTFHLILCRNLLYYFNQDTQKKIINKISKSLEYGGVLITD